MDRVTMQARSRPAAGDVLELSVGEVVHGGWCVSRVDDTGWVVFVRHALPAERVRAVVTQVTARFARADAVEILASSPDRVPVPCRYAGPGGCGGCDWQHASLPAQRELKAAVIRQQLSRLAGLDREVVVEAVPGDRNGLGWRTSVSFAVDQAGTAGLRRHRSREIVEVSECLIAHPLVTAAGVTGSQWPGAEAVGVSVVPETGERGIVVTRLVRRPGPADQPGKVRQKTGPGRRPRPADLPTLASLPGSMADSVLVTGPGAGRSPVRGRGYLTRRAAGRDWRVSLGGFWQVHPGAADLLVGAVLDVLEPRPGQTALDLYCGAGLFAGALAEAVGQAGRVLAIEADQAAVRDARHNLREWPWARVHHGDVAGVLGRTGLGGASIAVLDPPRTGAERPVIDALCAEQDAGPGLRRLAYVSCDPATLARDLRLLLDGGWRLDGLRGFDAFPMTHHVECLAALSRPALSRPARARPARARAG
jgi:tRNA/tmRNA/rRNA uracil-C5-methylase (TrmA/RlmC/RlmD family)